jgi:hypothetical protein
MASRALATPDHTGTQVRILARARALAEVRGWGMGQISWFAGSVAVVDAGYGSGL